MSQFELGESREAAWPSGNGIASWVRQIQLLCHPFLISGKLFSFQEPQLPPDDDEGDGEKLLSFHHTLMCPPPFLTLGALSCLILMTTLLGNYYSCLCLRGE